MPLRHWDPHSSTAFFFPALSDAPQTGPSIYLTHTCAVHFPCSNGALPQAQGWRQKPACGNLRPTRTSTSTSGFPAARACSTSCGTSDWTTAPRSTLASASTYSRRSLAWGPNHQLLDCWWSSWAYHSFWSRRLLKFSCRSSGLSARRLLPAARSDITLRCWSCTWGPRRCQKPPHTRGRTYRPSWGPRWSVPRDRGPLIQP